MQWQSEFRDTLTGAYSRAIFKQRFSEEVERAVRYHKNFSTLVMDLDHFKSINDAFGHLRGDAVLIEFVERINRILRGTDLLFRYGGDEFVVLLPETSLGNAILTAKRMLQSISDRQFNGEPPLSLTVSIGIASFPEDIQNPEDLFGKADLRMLEAKISGRAREIHEDSSVPVLPKGDSARIIERDKELQDMHAFFDRLQDSKRGVLQVLGPPGSGKSRFLSEVINFAVMNKFRILHLQGNPAQKDRPYGILNQLEGDWPAEICETTSKTRILSSLKTEMKKVKCHSLLMVLDDVDDIDRSTFQLIREILGLDWLSVIGCVYSGDRSIITVLGMNGLLFESLEMVHLSRDALKIWLRHLLRWDPPGKFINWLHRETTGLPGFAFKAVKYLCKRGILSKSNDHDWRISPEYRKLFLGDRIGVQTYIPPHNLPSSLTAFVGRRSEIRVISARLDEKRLVTLVGPGGIGKTRLALQVAAEKIRFFGEGVFFVAFSSTSSEQYIVSTIAESIGFSFHGNQDVLEQLLEHLKSREILLVMDNFEHLMKGRMILVKILERCPDIRIITTSRERLNLHGESIFEVMGMAVPLEGLEQGAEHFSAVRLFIQSARRGDPDFQVTKENTGSIIRICRLVEGMPLGIELAAAWVRVLTCREIAVEIEKNLDFLATSHTNVPSRHRSIRAAFEHSWTLLSEDEKKVFRRMSVFRGGFTREAAVDVVDAMLTTLTGLLDKSLLYKGSDGRYYILEVLRQFAEEKLENISDEASLTKRNHSRYYSKCIRAWLPLCEKAREKEFLDLVLDDLENIRISWLNAVLSSDIETLMDSIDGLPIFYDDSGMYQEGLELFGNTLKQLDNDSVRQDFSGQHTMELTGKLYNCCGLLHFKLSQYGESTESYQSGLIWSEKAGNKKEKAQSLNGLGGISSRLGDYSTAKNYYEKSLKIRRDIDDVKGIASSLNNLANIVGSMGKNHQAKQLYEESLVLARRSKDRNVMAALLANLGLVEGLLGERDRELELLKESLDIRRELGDRSGTAISLDNMGNVEHARGNYKEAEKLQREGLAIRREIGDKWGIGLSLLNLGNALNAQGEYEQGKKYLEESLRIYREIGDKWGTALALNNLGEVIQFKGDHAEAKTLIEESCALFEAMGDKWGIVLGQLNRGNGYFQAKDLGNALVYYKKAFAIASEINLVPNALDALLGIATVFEKSQSNTERRKALEILMFLDNQKAASSATLDKVTSLLETFSSPQNKTLMGKLSSTVKMKTLEDFADIAL
jgi:diguanylate cyclase (GGDEF)-like protein